MSIRILNTYIQHSFDCCFRPTYCIEFLPVKTRAVILCLLEVSAYMSVMFTRYIQFAKFSISLLKVRTYFLPQNFRAVARP